MKRSAPQTFALAAFVACCTPQPNGNSSVPAKATPVPRSGAASSPVAVFDCRLEMPALDAPCKPGTVDLRGAFGTACPARCDAGGRWQTARLCISALAGSSGAVYFHHNSRDPNPETVAAVRGALSQSSGRYYVLGWVDPSETVDGLALSRARAAIRALVAAGVCPEKFVGPLDAGVSEEAPVAQRDPEARAQALLADPAVDAHLRARGILPPSSDGGD